MTDTKLRALDECARCTIEDTGVCARCTYRQAALTPQEAEEITLRRLLWFRHGCPPEAAYGDDGEMQCGACLIDFKRMPAAEIEEAWRVTALQILESDGLTSQQEPTDD